MALGRTSVQVLWKKKKKFKDQTLMISKGSFAKVMGSSGKVIPCGQGLLQAT